jgi:predicted anti-sigma-YlaC factor YlaD
MAFGKRLLWHLLLTFNLVMGIFLSMFVGIALLGSREAGMMVGLASGLFLGQTGFAWRFLTASVWARIGAAAVIFLVAAITSTLIGMIGSLTNRFMYGLWDVIVPYLIVTIIFWEWAYKKQNSTRSMHD